MLYHLKNAHGGDVYDKEIVLDFSINVNPLKTPDSVRTAIVQSLDQIHMYPNAYCTKLVEEIAEHEDVPKDYILCGNGAAELIYSFCEAAGVKTAVEAAPTFSEYSLAVERAGGRVCRYFLKEAMDFAYDWHFLSFLEEINPDVIMLCHPNNPTGRLIESDILKEIFMYAKHHSCYLFVDECFLDFSMDGESMKKYFSEYSKLFILKAFTKTYGMAGLRLGYCMCPDQELLTRMSKTVQPWNVSLIAQAAGVAALRERAYLNAAKQLICDERQWMSEKLEQLGFYVYPSDVNYILFKGEAGLVKRLAQKGILIRDCSNYAGLCDGYYRAAVKLHKENEMLIQALDEGRV